MKVIPSAGPSGSSYLVTAIGHVAPIVPQQNVPANVVAVPLVQVASRPLPPPPPAAIVPQLITVIKPGPIVQETRSIVSQRILPVPTSQTNYIPVGTSQVSYRSIQRPIFAKISPVERPLPPTAIIRTYLIPSEAAAPSPPPPKAPIYQALPPPYLETPSFDSKQLASVHPSLERSLSVTNKHQKVPPLSSTVSCSYLSIV